MSRHRPPSPQTVTLLTLMNGQAQMWRYGYDLTRETGIQAGTLYPLLARLHDRGLLEAEWKEAQSPGRPPRHVYRLSAAGVALATSLGRQPKAATWRTQAI